MIYVASPYTHIQPEVREDRYKLVMHWIADNQQYETETLYSPIVYYHPMSVAHFLPTDWEYWWGLNKEMLDQSVRMIVLTMEGWDISTGVAQEIKYMTEKGKPIGYHTPEV